MYDADGELMAALSVWKSAWTPSPGLNERPCVENIKQKTLLWDQKIYSTTDNQGHACGENEAKRKKL